MWSGETSTGIEGDFNAPEIENFDENFNGKNSGTYFKHYLRDLNNWLVWYSSSQVEIQ